MSITIEQKSHGVVFKGLIDCCSEFSEELFYLIKPTKDSRSGYILEVFSQDRENLEKLKLGIYIKHSSARRSPWRYSFKDFHILELDILKEECDELFIILVAGDDGIACINTAKLSQILSGNFNDSSIAISRKLNESYRVSGSDGILSTPLAKNSFPNLLKNLITSRFNL